MMIEYTSSLGQPGLRLSAMSSAVSFIPVKYLEEKKIKKMMNMRIMMDGEYGEEEEDDDSKGLMKSPDTKVCDLSRPS